MSEFNDKGRPNGVWKQYWGNGQLKDEYNYIDGQFDGVGRSYHENGTLWVDAIYKNNFRVTWRRYFDDGRLDALELYRKNGQLYYSEYHSKNHSELIVRSFCL